MSARQVVATVSGLLEHAQMGLSARMGELAPLATVPVSTTLRFAKWHLPESMHPAMQHSVVVRPRGWAAALKDGAERDGTVSVQVMFEAFASDPGEIQETVLIAMAALMRCMDDLRAYSDSTNGTVIDFPVEISMRTGEFEGATTGGFIADMSINERGTE